MKLIINFFKGLFLQQMNVIIGVYLDQLGKGRE
jgi:hypothetical protein